VRDWSWTVGTVQYSWPCYFVSLGLLPNVCGHLSVVDIGMYVVPVCVLIILDVLCERHVCSVCNACRLNEEIEDFYSYMCPLPEERLMRQKVIERVTGLITELWPSAKVCQCNGLKYSVMCW